MALPQIAVGKLSVSRLVIGGNPFSGFSHQNAERDAEMRDYYTTARIKETLAACEQNGINTFFGRVDNHIVRLLREYWNEGGRIQWFAQTATEYGSEHANIRLAAANGAIACYLHGGAVASYYREDRLADARASLELIAELGMVPGLASHNPDIHVAAQELGLPFEFHMYCFYQLDGYQGRQDGFSPDDRFREEDRRRAVAMRPQLERQVFAYKVLAAGRNDPHEALKLAYSNLRASDGVVIGMFTGDNPNMVADNVQLVNGILAE